jgi:hypothetical protein
MRRVLLGFTVLAVAGVLAASSALAQQTPGFYLKWNDCVAGGGVADKSFGCASDAGNNFLVVSFIPPAPGAADTIHQATAVDCWIDLITASAGLPDWWAYQAGGCRTGGSMTASATFVTLSTCMDPWGGNASGGMNYTPAPDHNTASYGPLPNTARMEAVFAVAPQFAIRLTNDQEWYALYFVMKNNHTIVSPCAGCATPVCLVLNQMNLSQPAPTADTILLTSPTAGGNMATWQGGSGANCSTVPARRATWGEVKSLYR